MVARRVVDPRVDGGRDVRRRLGHGARPWRHPGPSQSLAKASEAAHPREALAVYAARVEQLVGAEGNGNYEESARLVVHMAGLREPSEQAAYVAELRMRLKTKRNFMKLLER